MSQIDERRRKMAIQRKKELESLRNKSGGVKNVRFTFRRINK